jgi:hypothetical protein
MLILIVCFCLGTALLRMPFLATLLVGLVLNILYGAAAIADVQQAPNGAAWYPVALAFATVACAVASYSLERTQRHLFLSQLSIPQATRAQTGTTAGATAGAPAPAGVPVFVTSGDCAALCGDGVAVSGDGAAGGSESAPDFVSPPVAESRPARAYTLPTRVPALGNGPGEAPASAPLPLVCDVSGAQRGTDGETGASSSLARGMAGHGYHAGNHTGALPLAWLEPLVCGTSAAPREVVGEASGLSGLARGSEQENHFGALPHAWLAPSPARRETRRRSHSVSSLDALHKSMRESISGCGDPQSSQHAPSAAGGAGMGGGPSVERHTFEALGQRGGLGGGRFEAIGQRDGLGGGPSVGRHSFEALGHAVYTSLQELPGAFANLLALRGVTSGANSLEAVQTALAETGAASLHEFLGKAIANSLRELPSHLALPLHGAARFGPSAKRRTPPVGGAGAAGSAAFDSAECGGAGGAPLLERESHRQVCGRFKTTKLSTTTQCCPP